MSAIEVLTCGGCGKGVAINPDKHQYSVKYCPWCRTIVVSTFKVYDSNPFWDAQKRLQESARQMFRRGKGYMDGLIPGMSPAHLMEYAKYVTLAALGTAAAVGRVLRHRPDATDTQPQIDKDDRTDVE